MNTKQSSTRELVSNRRALYDYEIVETFEVGIQLVGTEITSLRSDGGSLQDAFISVEKGELYLIGASIKPYSFGGHYNHEERRKRKLLAHRREIKQINEAIREKGLTCIPLRIFLKNGYAKLVIATAKGKKLHDKREAVKARDDKREMGRALKQNI